VGRFYRPRSGNTRNCHHGLRRRFGCRRGLWRGFRLRDEQQRVDGDRDRKGRSVEQIGALSVSAKLARSVLDPLTVHEMHPYDEPARLRPEHRGDDGLVRP
jgi:hypothetical protein